MDHLSPFQRSLGACVEAVKHRPVFRYNADPVEYSGSFGLYVLHMEKEPR